ncbi:MAG TPA: biotin/lipoyl-containing protein, partial [Caldimonas sp.]|nr:biotin/lipoyl-containing protein [Caldimonas sp.]
MTPVKVVSPLAGSVVAVAVEAGASVARGALIAVVESMKMEHEVHASCDGVVDAVRHGV